MPKIQKERNQRSLQGIQGLVGNNEELRQAMIDYDAAREMGGIPNPLDIINSSSGRSILMMHLLVLVGSIVAFVSPLWGNVVSALSLFVIAFMVATSTVFGYKGPIKNQKLIIQCAITQALIYYSVLVAVLVILSFTKSLLGLVIITVLTPFAFMCVVSNIVRKILALESRIMVVKEKIVEEKRVSESICEQDIPIPSRIASTPSSIHPNTYEDGLETVRTTPTNMKVAPNAGLSVREYVRPTQDTVSVGDYRSPKDAVTSKDKLIKDEMFTNFFSPSNFNLGSTSLKITLGLLPLLFVLDEDVMRKSCSMIVSKAIRGVPENYTNPLTLYSKIINTLTSQSPINIPRFEWASLMAVDNYEKLTEAYNTLRDFNLKSDDLEKLDAVVYGDIMEKLGVLYEFVVFSSGIVIESQSLFRYIHIPTNRITGFEMIRAVCYMPNKTIAPTKEWMKDYYEKEE